MYFGTQVATVFILTSFSVFSRAQKGPGVTMDNCKQDSDCRAPRNCRFSDGDGNLFDCPAPDEFCFCLPGELTLCEYIYDDADPKSCPYEERCTRLSYNNTIIDFCMSCIQSKNFDGKEGFEIPDTDAVTCNASNETSSGDDTSAGGSSTGTGRNMDSCVSEDQCFAPRSCVLIQDSLMSACSGASGCVCYDLTNRFVCTSQAECPDEYERCARPSISEEAYKGECTSTNVIGNNRGFLDIREVERKTENSETLFSGDSNLGTGPGTSSNNPGVCVDATLLSHFHPSKLVFSTHRRASVLCDAFRSCATPGHILQYGFKVMSMHTYCEKHATCTRRLSLVNSPKFKRGLRIKSRTANLSFTALAARYETKWEERALRLLVAIGF